MFTHTPRGLPSCLAAAAKGHAEPTIVYTLTKREAQEIAASLEVRCSWARCAAAVALHTNHLGLVCIW